jgi:GntR family transcriptional regulator, transcriptional repressor for pyruvate dehydrogenase complex
MGETAVQSTISLERPRKVTVVQSIVEQIVRQVQTGNLKVGDKLPSERRLIEMLQVSRSSVREALQALAMMGVIESRAGQGSFVSYKVQLPPIDLNEPSLPAALQRDMLLALIESRRCIEGAVAYLAAERATSAALAVLRTAFEDYRRHERIGALEEGAVDYHRRFHCVLAEMTGNSFFVLVVDTLLRAVPLSLREGELVGRGEVEQDRLLAIEIDLHKAILTAVERGDGASAQQAMHEHMNVELHIVEEAFPNR